MTIQKTITHIAFLLCLACRPEVEERPPLRIPEPSRLLSILERGTLDISTFYNTTDFYIYQGVTKGFHYDLAQDFARHLGVRLQIVEVNTDADTAIARLREGRYDLLALSLTQTPERRRLVRFTDPLFHTGEVLVQGRTPRPLQNPAELDGKEVFLPRSSDSYQNTLRMLQDSLHIRIATVEADLQFNEDLLHLVETGLIDYTVTDANIARNAAFSMKNIDCSLRLRDSIAISWGVPPQDELLAEEVNAWLQGIRKSGRLTDLYRRYFEKRHSLPGNLSKYALLKKGKISPFDLLLKKESRRLGWDWRLLAALVYAESQFDPDAISPFGACGLMQVLPETAAEFGVQDCFLPDSNVHAGVSYLKFLDKYFSPHVPDAEERVKFVLAAYNAGQGHVMDAIRLATKYGKDPRRWENNTDFYLLHKNKPQYYRDPAVRNGYCNGAQTYRYVTRVLETYNNYKNIKE